MFIYTVDGSVVAVFEAHQQIGMWSGSVNQPAQNLGEFALAQLTRSTSTAGEFSKTRDVVNHVTVLGFDTCDRARPPNRTTMSMVPSLRFLTLMGVQPKIEEPSRYQSHLASRISLP